MTEKYALVQEGTVVKVVPGEETTINHIEKATVSQRLSRGWYEYTEVVPKRTDWEQYTQEVSYLIDEELGTVEGTVQKTVTLLDDYKQAHIRRLKATASQHIYSQAPTYKQINVALGVTGYEENSDKAASIKQLINDTIAVVNLREQQILAATTHEEVFGVSVEFV